MLANIPFLTPRRWQVLIGILVLVALYFVFRPERPPAEVIRENLYTWAAQLEKSPTEGTAASPPQDVAAGASAALLEDYGYVRRLMRSAFTEDAQIQAVRGPREQGRDALTKWCFSLRTHADSIALELHDVSVHFDPSLPTEATASLRVHVDARYLGQSHTQTYQCELQLLRDPDDKQWRIAHLVARHALGSVFKPPSEEAQGIF